MQLLKKVQTFMMGGQPYDDEEYVTTDYYEEEYIDEEPLSLPYKSSAKRDKPTYQSSFDRGAGLRGGHFEAQSNVLTMPGSSHSSAKNMFICKPKSIEEAAAVCKQFKDLSICVVTLEGIPQPEAQRIADLLSGACFVLDGTIERITNCVFVMSPAGFGVTSDLKDQLKKADSLFSWVMPGSRG